MIGGLFPLFVACTDVKRPVFLSYNLSDGKKLLIRYRKIFDSVPEWSQCYNTDDKLLLSPRFPEILEIK